MLFCGKLFQLHALNFDKFFNFLDNVLSDKPNEKQIENMTEERFGNKIKEMLPAIKKAGLKLNRGPGQLEDLLTVDQTDYGVLR